MSNHKVTVTDPISLHLERISKTYQDYLAIAQELRELIAKTYEFDNIEVVVKPTK